MKNREFLNLIGSVNEGYIQAQAASVRRTLSARLRTIRPAKLFSDRGRWGGIACQHCSHISLTHSSAAPGSLKMFWAMAVQ